MPADRPQCSLMPANSWLDVSDRYPVGGSTRGRGGLGANRQFVWNVAAGEGTRARHRTV